MKFGRIPIAEAAGSLAAHSLRAGDRVIRKGTLLTAADTASLAAAGTASVIVASLEPGDVLEGEAAGRLAAVLAGECVWVDKPFTGRANLFARHSGVLVVDGAAVDAVNRIDEGVTVATLAAFRPVVEGEMIATVKIIPYAVPGAILAEAEAAGRRAVPVIGVAPYRINRIGVVSTLLPALKASVVAKTLAVLGERLAPAGARVVAESRVPHDTAALTAELQRLAAGEAELLIVFGASAVADRRDVVPAAIEAAGGRVEHLGMPVDPGNLLLIGQLDGKPVIGAPGCARSPKENGFDWILHRLLAGLRVSRDDIMGLGVGGLLMEIVTRPQPRAGGEKGDGR